MLKLNYVDKIIWATARQGLTPSTHKKGLLINPTQLMLDNKNVNIYMARHGQDKDNAKGILNGRRDEKLTKIGIIQANNLGSKIKEIKIKFDKIYCSPLKRAHKTAQIISKQINGPRPIIMKDLVERNFGVMTGRPYSCIASICTPHVLHTKNIVYFLKAEKAETFPQLLKRGQLIINQIKEQENQKNILLVTHGDIGVMIYAAFYNLDWKEGLKKFHFRNTDLVLLSDDSNLECVYIKTFKEKQSEIKS